MARAAVGIATWAAQIPRASIREERAAAALSQRGTGFVAAGKVRPEATTAMETILMVAERAMVTMRSC